MNLQNIPIYVITTKTLKARHEHMESLAQRLGVRFDYIFDHDIEELTGAQMKCICSDMPLASISCLLKHFEAQARFLDTDAQFCIVLEDDVVLFDEFEAAVDAIIGQISTLAPGWLIFLGGADNKLDDRFVKSGPFDLIVAEMSTAECYALDRNGCEQRRDWIEKNGLAKPADHQLTWMDKKLEITHFRLGRPVATQGSITGKFPTTLDDSRRKHSSIFLLMKYHWNRLRRQLLPRFIGATLDKIK